MPDFVVTDSSGKKYRIPGPEGATQEQAQQEFDKQQGRLRTPQAASVTRQGGWWRGQPDPVGFVAGLASGAIGVGEEGYKLATTPLKVGGVDVSPFTMGPLGTLKAAGVDPASLIPDYVKQQREALRQRAERNPAGRVGETVGSALPFVAQPETGIPKLAASVPAVGKYLLRPAASVLERSTLPGVLQPTDPNTKDYWGDKRRQAEWATAVGAPLQAAGAGASAALSKWDLADVAARVADQTKQTIGRFNDLAAQFRASKVSDAEAADAARKLIPQQVSETVYQGILNLVGEGSQMPKKITYQTPGTVRKIVGEKLSRIYEQMSFDPNKSGWLANASAIRDQIRNALRTNPALQERWDRIFGDKAIIPAFHTEAGALPGQAGGYAAPGPPPVTSIGGTTMRQPTAIPSDAAPMGGRSGAISGETLNNVISALGDYANEFGLKSQAPNVPEGDLYRQMAIGLRQIKSSIERQIDEARPDLANQRETTNLGYQVVSRMMDAVKATGDGTATPAEILNAIQQAEGNVGFASATKLQPLKTAMQAAHQQHVTPAPQPPPLTPAKDQPPAKASDPSLPETLGPAAVHTVLRGAPPGLIREALQLLARGGRKVAQPVIRGRPFGPFDPFEPAPMTPLYSAPLIGAGAGEAATPRRREGP